MLLMLYYNFYTSRGVNFETLKQRQQQKNNFCFPVLTFCKKA